MKRLLTTTLLILVFHISYAKECRTMSAWQGYFAERLNLLDPIEGIYDIQIKFGYNGAPSTSTDGQFAIAKLSGNLFEMYSIGGENMSVLFERVGNTHYYYIYESNLGFKERFLLNDDGTFLVEHHESHRYSNWSYNFYSGLTIRTPQLVVTSVYESGIKMFPEKNTVQAALYNPVWSGSGFALNEGYIVTNHHVAGSAKLIRVFTGENNDKYFDAQLIASDPVNDLAVIKVNDKEFSGYGTIPYTIDERLKEVASECFVMGYPKTDILGREIKYTNGTISAWSGYEGNVSTYQISAPVTNGNSGGPTFDSEGNVIGILSSGVPSLQNVGYAVKAAYLMELLRTKSLESALPTSNQIKSLPIPEKVKSIKPFVYFLLCTSSGSWDNLNQSHGDSPYEWELPKRVIKPKPISFKEQKEINEGRIKAIKKEKGQRDGKIDYDSWKNIHITLKADGYVCNQYGESEGNISNHLLPIFIDEFNKSVKKRGYKMTSEKTDTANIEAVLEILLVDSDDGETYSILSFYSGNERKAQVYLNGDGGKGNTVLQKSEKSIKRSAKELADDFLIPGIFRRK